MPPIYVHARFTSMYLSFANGAGGVGIFWMLVFQWFLPTDQLNSKVSDVPCILN